MEFIKIYFEFIKKYMKAKIEYRYSFLFGIFTNFYCYLITFLTFKIILNRFGSINGWTFEEICLLYGLNLLTYAIAGMFFWPVFRIENDITSGNLDSYLIRPLGLIKHLVCRQFGDTFIGQIIVSVIFLIKAIIALEVKFSFEKYVFLIIVTISGTLIQAAAMIAIGSLAFWMNRSSQLGDILYYDFRKFTEYPLSIFPKTIQVILSSILPWALISYYPTLVILDKVNNNVEYLLGILSPILAIVIFKLALYLFDKGLRKYNGSGN